MHRAFCKFLFLLIFASNVTCGTAAAAVPLNIVRLLPDPARPRLYAISSNGKEQGSILVIDTLTKATIQTIAVGKEPTDFDLTENSAELLVMNTTDRSISRINLTTLAVTATHLLTQFDTRNEDFGGHVVDGPGDILYYVDEQWGPRLRVYDTVTGTVLQTFGATTTGTGNDYGFGDVVVNPGKTELYGWVQYGDGAGWAGSFVVRYAIASNGTLSLADQGRSDYPTPLNREPYDSPALMTADGSSLVIKNRVVDLKDADLFPITYPNNIYSLSPNGKIVATSTAILPGGGGEILHTLPVAATVQAILPDYSAMAYFNGTTKAIVWLDLIKTLGSTALGLKIEPGDGMTVATPGKLEWFPVTGISRYQLYLGTSRSAVEAATSTSPSYLGETGSTTFTLTTPLVNGQTYFWRVVPVGADGVPAGAGITRSFLVANLTLSRNSITAESVEGVRRHVESIQLTAATSQPWSATADVPWITFEAASGSTPGNLVAVLNASALAAGNHAGKITLTSGGASFAIPVSLKLYAANYTIAETDLELPWVYLVSQENNSSGQPSFLLRIDTATHRIESAVPCGRSVTDLAIHYQENRIYLTNWQTGILRAFDRGTFKQVQTYQFTPAGAVGYSQGDIWEVSAGKNGQLIVEEYDQWIDMRLISTIDGKTLATGSSREGGGIFEPAGRYYFHGENNSSGAMLRKYDIAPNKFLEMKASRVETFSYYGSRKVVMSGDGSRIFWNGGVFDQNLDVQLRYPAEIVGSTFHADLLFTSDKVYNGANGLEVASLPVSTKVMSVTGDQKKLYLFPANSKAFQTVDLSTIANLPSRELTPTVADGSKVIGTSQSLDWSIEPFASSYKVYFGTSRASVANATETSAEYLGTSATDAWTGNLPALSLGGEYFWRVDVIGYSGSRKGAVWSFSVAPLDVSPVKLDVVLPVGSPLTNRTFAISGPAGSAWTATTSTPWLSVPPGGGTTPGSLTLGINVAGLAVGARQGSVTFTSGTDSWSLPVSLELLALNYTLAEADLEAPYIYAISQAASGTDDRAFLVVIDTLTNAISKVIPVGRSATDVSVHYPENRIYVSNWQSGKLLALDRNTFAEVRTYSYGATGGTSGNGDVYKVAAGRSGRVVIEQQDQWVNFYLIDTASGNKLATGYAREGGGVFDPTGRHYYHGENNSSGAEIHKYDTGSNAFTKLASKRVAGFNYYGSRRVLTSGDGSRVFWNGGVFDPDLNVLLQLTNEVVSSTYRGEVLFTDKAAVNGVNAETLATLPVTTSIQAVSADQNKLFLFKAGDFSVVDIATIAKVSPRGLIPGIADGAAVIGTAQSLSWSQEAAALSYDVYFGTSAAAVSAATKSSPEFLGNTPGTRWTGAMPALEYGKSYWWRVDIAGFNSSLKGATWSFKIPLINVVPQAVDLAYPTASPIPVQRLALTSPAGGSVAWTASTVTPWITLKSSAGTAPGSLDFDVSSTGLTAGLKEGSIAFNVGGDTFHVPVRLRILALNITKLVAHPTRPVVYGINTAAAGEGFSHLLEIDASTALILRSLPIGFSPTDADLDAKTERLYVSNWGYSSTRVIDVAKWSELPSLALGDDVFKLEITPGGKLVTEEQDQWIDLSLWNASTGLKLGSSTSVREGDGEADPTGQFYYHSDNNSSGAVVTKYNISGNSFVSVATGPQIGYGSRNLILSGNGSKLFWLGRVLDSNLKLLGQMPGEVHATTGAGDLAVGPGHVWWSDSGTLVTALPFTSTVAAISAYDADLVRFNPLTKTLHSTSLKDFTDLPGPYPRPDQVLDVSPARLSWSPVAGATSYRVFIAPNATALLAMTTPVVTVLTNYYDLPSPLAFGKSYSWRVDAVTGSTTTGKIRSFSIRFPEGSPLPATATDSHSQGISASISDRHVLVGSNGAAQLYEFNPTTGAAKALQKFALDDHYTQHYFGNSVAVDAGKASIGAYSFDSPLGGNGSVFLYRSGESGAWESSGPLTLPAPVSNESFGRGLAASGNLMLAGTGYTSFKIGRVAAYITEPVTTQIQVFSAGDPVAGDGFGQVIAMTGNQAIISAPGSGLSYNRLPSLYSFTRSTTTGLWTQRQKIVIPGATGSSSGSVLALSENYLATNNATNASVEIFTKNDSGQWVPSASIKQSTVPGSFSYSFGKALAISGDLLFIGDTGATSQGTSGGAVFSFRRSGAAWIAGPAITPRGTYSGFGGVLALRDGWLLATGNAKPGWLFRVDSTANQAPRFLGNVPTQVVAGRPFATEIRTEDADGNQGLLLDLLQGPSWLKLTNDADGKATLSGIPTGLVNSVDTVQLRVRDTAGAQALHTYQLTTLAATSLPVLTLEPSGSDAGEGQEVVLRAAVSGIGPFTWQWHRDGKPIAGATRDTLVFGEIALGDAGSYAVSVANVVGQDESAAAAIKVHAANRFAGNWPTFGGSTKHTGYHPARLGRHSFVAAWSRVIHPTNALNRVVVADGRVFVSASSRFETSPSIKALDLTDGKVLWTESIASSNSINPPSWHNGTVYFQRGKGVSDSVGPQLIALDATSGKRKWASVFGAQWESYEAPAVTDGGVWINGGAYGGMYGFTLAGSQTFFKSMAQYDGWTPTVSNDRLFSWVAGLFQEHNPADGSTLWSVDGGWNWSGWSVNNVAAISGESAAVISTTEIVCIDLSSHAIKWRKNGNFQGSPAISASWVYGIQDKTVVSYSLADGTPGPVVSLPESIISGQPLLLMDYLLVASAAKTFVVDRATAAIVQTLPGGGLLSFAQGRLFAAGTDGTLRAWSVNGGLEFTSDPLPVVANPRADASHLDLAPLVEDRDGNLTHQWEITSNSNPALFSEMWVDQNGRLEFAYAPYISGTSSLTVTVRNAAGSFARTTIQFTLPKPPAPSVKADPAIRLNRATGLYEQKVTVKNIAARAIAGFDLTISGLRSGIVLHNGTSTSKSGGVFIYNKPLAAGESVTVLLQYYASIRGAIPQPLIRASLAGPAATAKSGRVIASEKPFSISRYQVRPDRSMILEFPTEPGRNYRIHYSADAIHWKTCRDIIINAGTKVQWIDRGPPWTDLAPASVPSRFYRIERLDP